MFYMTSVEKFFFITTIVQILYYKGSNSKPY